MAKKDFAGLIKLRILRWWTLNVSWRETADRREEGIVTTEAEIWP